MSTPIGSLQFLVKFDSMQNEFVDALKDALKDGDLDFDSDKIDEMADDVKKIKFNVENRLRGIISGDQQQLRALAVPELNFLADPANIQKFADVLETSKTGKRLYGQGSGESTEEHKKRLSDTAERIFGSMSWHIGKATQDEKFFDQNKNLIKKMQHSIQLALDTSWEYMIQVTSEQLTDETEMKREFHKWLQERGAKVAPKEKHWYQILKTIGSGGTKLTQDLLIGALGGLDLTEEQVEELFHEAPHIMRDKDARDAIMSLLRDFTIPAGKTRLPGNVVKTMEAIMKGEIDETSSHSGTLGATELLYKPKAKGYKKADVLPIILDEESLERVLDGLEERSIDPEAFEEFADDARAFFDAAGWWLTPTELGVFVGAGKEYEKRWMKGKGAFIGTSIEEGATEATHFAFPKLGRKPATDIEEIKEGQAQQTAEYLVKILDEIKTLKDTVEASSGEISDDVLEKLDEKMDEVSKILDE